MIYRVVLNRTLDNRESQSKIEFQNGKNLRIYYKLQVFSNNNIKSIPEIVFKKGLSTAWQELNARASEDT